MKERPILFSAPMVRAILDGRKTQTRRIVKPQPAIADGFWWLNHKTGRSPLCKETDSIAGAGMQTYCPFGIVGDRLWVRETWCHAADENDRFKYNSEGNLDSSCCHYRADGYEVLHIDGEETKSGKPKSPWAPSIHMPRWASRINLEITGVRVERLNEITVEDAIAEGIEKSEPTGAMFKDYRCGKFLAATPMYSFFSLWESINGQGSWAANPWVWVVEFGMVQL